MAGTVHCKSLSHYGGVSRDASTTLTRGGGATTARGGKGRRLGRRLDPCPPCSDRDALIDWVSMSVRMEILQLQGAEAREAFPTMGVLEIVDSKVTLLSHSARLPGEGRLSGSSVPCYPGLP